MVDGVRLTLMIGPAVPLPVSREVLDALTAVNVNTGGDGIGGFQLTFNLTPDSPLHTLFVISGGAPVPLMRVVIVATVNGTPTVLTDGVMTNHQVTSDENGEATMTVTGEDSLRRWMGYFDFSGFPFPALTVELRVLAILAKYAIFGVVPMVIPSVFVDVPIPVDRIPLQNGTDLDYVQALADEVGYVFQQRPGPFPGMVTGYFGPKVKNGYPQKALTVGPPVQATCEGFTATYKGDSRKLKTILIQNQATKAPIPIPLPPITPLNPALGIVQPFPIGLDPIEDTAKLTPVRAVGLGLAEAAKDADVITASGTVDVLRYGRLLEPHGLVGVRGAGFPLDGLYYVESVSHDIKRGSYRQSFTLSRNGLISTLPTVPV